MTNELSQEKSRIEAGMDRLDTAMLLSILAVVIGLVIEYLLEFIPGTDPGLLAIAHKVGGGIVTLGVSSELVVEYKRGKRGTRLREINDSVIAELHDRAAAAEKQAAEANLARVKIEEKMASRRLTEELKAELTPLLTAYPGPKRVDVFAYDSHILEVHLLADGIHGTFLSAGWDSKIWLVDGFRASGTEFILASARECAPEETLSLQYLAFPLSFILGRHGIKAGVASNGFSTKELLANFRGYCPWNNDDVAKFRIQIGEKQLIDPFS